MSNRRKKSSASKKHVPTRVVQELPRREARFWSFIAALFLISFMLVAAFRDSPQAVRAQLTPPPFLNLMQHPYATEGNEVESFESVDDPPAAVHATPREPRLEVRIAGPVDVLVGDMVELAAETTAEATSFAWSIDPPAQGLIVMDGGSKAVFANRQAGEYLVIVSCANAHGDTAHATRPFTLRPSPPENPLTVESLAEANPPPDLSDLIRRWVAEVQSENKFGEAATVAGSLRQTANLLAQNSLQITGDGDPLFEVEKAAELAMGPGNFPKWHSFFARVRDFLYPLNVRGYVVSPQDYHNTFNNLASELEAISAGR